MKRLALVPVIASLTLIMVSFQNCGAKQNYQGESESASQTAVSEPSAVTTPSTPAQNPPAVQNPLEPAGKLIGGCYTGSNCQPGSDEPNGFCQSGTVHVYPVDVYCSQFVTDRSDCGRFTTDFWAMVCN